MKTVLLVIAAGLLVTACAPQKRYRILSFFFDGVPAPARAVEQSRTAADGDSVVASPAAVAGPVDLVQHPPYRENRCTVCHVGQFSSSLVKPVNSLCFDCHGGYRQRPGTVHGPVATGFCVACHDPHTTRTPHLVTRSGNALCVFCHTHLNETRSRGHADTGERACLDCHEPHSSEKSRYLLRETGGIE